MFSRCVADFALLDIELAAAHAAMVDSPRHHVAAHFGMTPQLQLHYATTTTTVAVHDTTSSSCGRGDHCNHCNHSSKHNSNHLSVNQCHHYNSTTLQLQLQLQYMTLHPAVVGEVTTATIATIPANTTPTTFRSISGFALPSVIHNNERLL